MFVVSALLVFGSSGLGFHNIRPIVSQNSKILGNKTILLNNVINLANIIKTQNVNGTKKCAQIKKHKKHIKIY